MKTARRASAVLFVLALALSVGSVGSVGVAPAAASGADFTLVPQNVSPDGNGLINDMPIEVRGGQVSASASGPGEWLGQKGSSTATVTGTYDATTGTFAATYTGQHRNSRQAGDIVQDVIFTFTGEANQQFDSNAGTVQISFSGPLTTEVTGGPENPPTTTKDYTVSVVYAIEGAATSSGPSEQASPAGGAPGAGTGPQEVPESGGGFPVAAVLAGLAAVGVVVVGIVLWVRHAAGASQAAATVPVGGVTPGAGVPAGYDTWTPVAPGPAAAGDSPEDQDEDEDEDEGSVLLSFTFPAGPSPKVFTHGWLFGARAIANPGRPDEQDISDAVEWSGSGSFSPPTGRHSRPAFATEGANTITIRVEHEGKVVARRLGVSAVSPAGFSHVGSLALCPADAHGCPACPHTTTGPVRVGSPTVLVNGMPAARLGDVGVHASCCGPNTFVISGYSQHDVVIDGSPAARLGDETRHCGGIGQLVSGGP